MPKASPISQLMETFGAAMSRLSTLANNDYLTRNGSMPPKTRQGVSRTHPPAQQRRKPQARCIGMRPTVTAPITSTESRTIPACAGRYCTCDPGRVCNRVWSGQRTAAQTAQSMSAAVGPCLALSATRGVPMAPRRSLRSASRRLAPGDVGIDHDHRRHTPRPPVSRRLLRRSRARWRS